METNETSLHQTQGGSEHNAGGSHSSERGAAETRGSTTTTGTSNGRAKACRERTIFDPSDIPPDIRGGPFDPNATNPYDPNDPNNPDNRDNDDPDEKPPPPQARDDETNNPADLDTHPPAPRAPNRPGRNTAAEQAIAQARQAIKHSQENSQPNVFDHVV